jgi:hypothetical protein
MLPISVHHFFELIRIVLRPLIVADPLFDKVFKSLIEKHAAAEFS